MKEKKMKVCSIFIFSFFLITPLALSETSSYEPIKIPKKVPNIPELKSLNTINRIKDIERQLNYLEQQNKFQEDQIKRLERSVDELKRKR